MNLIKDLKAFKNEVYMKDYISQLWREKNIKSKSSNTQVSKDTSFGKIDLIILKQLRYN